MSVEWITYKGKQILHNDSRGLRGEGLMAMIELEAKMIAEASSPVLILDDFTGCTVNSAAMERVKQLGREVIEPNTEKNAILGIEGIKLVFLNAYNWFTGAGERQRTFKRLEDAKEWLIE